MSTFEFKTPVSEEDIKKVHIGDVIYLTGDIVTGRDDSASQSRNIRQGTACGSYRQSDLPRRTNHEKDLL